jgi:aryl-alcohol dehydrogenase-like predicted oxidoreductase
LAAVARVHGVTPGQVALAWVHQQSRRRNQPVLSRPGTTSISHLRANVAAAQLDLNDADVHQLTAMS